MRLGNSPGKPGGKGKRHRKPVGHPDNDIADGVTGGEVLFNVRVHACPLIVAARRLNLGV